MRQIYLSAEEVAEAILEAAGVQYLPKDALRTDFQLIAAALNWKVRERLREEIETFKDTVLYNGDFV